MNNQPPKTPYECRKFFEASLSGLAKLNSLAPQHLRQNVKWFLIRNNIIKKSTTELKPETLELFAERISKFVNKMNSVPPNERSEVNFDNLFLND